MKRPSSRFGIPMAQYVYTMNRVGKIVPPKRVILKDISLSFFPGAKIGVLGANGSGKSSLLRIMAGEDEGYTGEARLTPGFTGGPHTHEPLRVASLGVAGTVAQGAGEIPPFLERYNAVTEAMGDPNADFDALLGEQ